ncbi:MAG: YCF48-related protein [Candidatus Thorarchaeota archaeon]
MSHDLSGNSNVTFWDVHFVNETHGWVIGKNGSGIYGGMVLSTIDAGNSWQVQLYNESQIFRQVVILDNLIIWVTGLGGLFFSDDLGNSWKFRKIVDSLSNINTVNFLNTTYGWTAAAGNLYVTSDGGQSWQEKPGLPYNDDRPRSIHFINETDFWMIGFYGIYHTSDAGQSWTQHFDEGGWEFSFTDENEAWAVADDLLLHMIDGQTWIEQPKPRSTVVPIPSPPYFSDIVFLDTANGWIAGSETFVAYTPNGGIDWYSQQISIEPVGRVMALSLTNTTHGWAVGHNGLIMHSQAANSLGIGLFLENSITNPLIVTSLVGLSVAIVIVIIIYLKRKLRQNRP